jgi:LEA14-like dessication related protein
MGKAQMHDRQATEEWAKQVVEPAKNSNSIISRQFHLFPAIPAVCLALLETFPISTLDTLALSHIPGARAMTATSRPTLLLLLTTLAFLTLTGCAAMEDYLGGMSKPGVTFKSARVDSLTLDHATMVFDVEITNPYSVPLPLTDLTYGLSTSGKPFFSGKAPIAGSVDAKGSRVVSLPVDVSYAQAINAGAGIKPGAVIPYAADLAMSLDAPGVGKMDFPMRKEGKLAIPLPPKMELTNLKWSSLSFNKAQALLSLKLTNPNSFGIDLSKIETGLSLAGTKVGNVGSDKALSLGENSGAKTLDLPMSFSPIDFGLAFFKTLSGSSAGYELDYTLKGRPQAARSCFPASPPAPRR